MLKRTIGLLVVSVFSLTGVQGEATPPDPAVVRLVEGKIANAAERPIEGARVLFGPSGFLSFPEEATATTNAEGRFQVDLGRFPWATKKIRGLVLAPGFAVAEQSIEMDQEKPTANFQLTGQEWKHTEILLRNDSDQPVADAEVTLTVGGRLVWARARTDAEGKCRITMAPGMPTELSARPAGARPVITSLGETDDEPPSVTLPVLPPIRGRVVDVEGRPVSGVAIGQIILYQPNGAGRMFPIPGTGNVVTDEQGQFVIAPPLTAHEVGDLKASRRSKTRLLCFADPGFQRLAYRLFDPTKSEPMEVILKPSRRLHVPIESGSDESSKQAVLGADVFLLPYEDLPDFRIPLVTRMFAPDEQGLRAVYDETLPEGRYRLSLALRRPAPSEQVEVAKRDFVMSEGDKPLDLPTLKFHPPDSANFVGKPVPAIDATDLKTGDRVTLADFKGKVVVLDFWGHWCGPCLIDMPRLAELQSKFEGRPLAVVALHDQSVQTPDEYERKIAIKRQRLWAGRELPIRVLLDRPDPEIPDDIGIEGHGLSIAHYGVTSFPTLFVIDSHGTVAGQFGNGQHERLEALVRDLLE